MLDHISGALPLDDPRWSALRHAYGPAEDVPEMIVALMRGEEDRDVRDIRDRLWHRVWSAQSHHASSRSSGAEAHRPDDELIEHGRLVLLPTRRKARIDGLPPRRRGRRPRARARAARVPLPLRPPLALDRLKILADDLVCIELKHPWSNAFRLRSGPPTSR